MNANEPSDPHSAPSLRGAPSVVDELIAERRLEAAFDNLEFALGEVARLRGVPEFVLVDLLGEYRHALYRKLDGA